MLTTTTTTTTAVATFVSRRRPAPAPAPVPVPAPPPPAPHSPASSRHLPALSSDRSLHHHDSVLATNNSPSSSAQFSVTPRSSMAEFRHLRSGSLNIPPTQSSSASMSPVTPSQTRFEGARSPPNTSHVPCKFFRQGACQAGTACPFSHDLGVAAETICKYFAKGNCKFGPKCANVHVLADGRRINYGKNGITIGQPLHLGNRVSPTTAAGYSGSGSGSGNNSNSALTNSFMRADATGTGAYSSLTYPLSPDERSQHQLARQPSLDSGLPNVDSTYSHTSSQYGSPRDDEASRLGLGLSPLGGKGLSVLDAPLPASFDSNGISNAARFPSGPWPSSVPSQFGLESPSPSLNAAKESRTSEALKLLHHSAFGGDHSTLSSALASGAHGAGSSPPTHATEEYFGKRQMHSSRYAKPKMLSSSAPRAIIGAIDRDWEAEFPFLEEDYVPDNLKDLLTPAEKARRGSRAAEDEMNGHSSHRSVSNGIAMAGTSASGSGAGTPNAEATSKFGSPSGLTGASPSRWGPLFQRQQEDQEAKKHAAAASAGAFGHVGSPLRNSMLSGDLISSHQHSLNGSRSGSMEGLSVLTQQLQRTRIDDVESPHLHPTTSNATRPANGRAERHVSSGSISSSARFTTPIGEEDGEFVFSMDEDAERDGTIRARKRTSGLGTAMGAWANGNPISSYAGVSSAAKKDDGSRVVDGVGGR